VWSGDARATCRLMETVGEPRGEACRSAEECSKRWRLKSKRLRTTTRGSAIAKLTGKPKSEISLFLAMQRVTPVVQATVRSDGEGQFSRRHVVALSKLGADEQPAMAERIKTEKLSAVETERAVDMLQWQRDGKPSRGASVSMRRYAIGSTQVRITFRKRAVERADILEVLDRVRQMVEREHPAE
jgi:hypothetical protein